MAKWLRKQAREKEMAAQAAKVGPLAQVAALAASERPKTGDKIPRSTKIAPFSDLSCKAEDAISKYYTVPPTMANIEVGRGLQATTPLLRGQMVFQPQQHLLMNLPIHLHKVSLDRQ